MVCGGRGEQGACHRDTWPKNDTECGAAYRWFPENTNASPGLANISTSCTRLVSFRTQTCSRMTCPTYPMLAIGRGTTLASGTFARNPKCRGTATWCAKEQGSTHGSTVLVTTRPGGRRESVGREYSVVYSSSPRRVALLHDAMKLPSAASSVEVGGSRIWRTSDTSSPTLTVTSCGALFAPWRYG